MGKTYKDKEKFWRKERLRNDTEYPSLDYNKPKRKGRKKINKKDLLDEEISSVDSRYLYYFN